MKVFTRRSKKAGLPPGTIVHIGEQRMEKVRISVIEYDKDHLEEKEYKQIDDFLDTKHVAAVTWINIDGVHETAAIEKIGSHYNLHPLTLEDIASTNQRPKVEDFDNYMFVVLKMLQLNDEFQTTMEQLSLVLGSNFVISFQETRGDVFSLIRERLRSNKGRIRRMGPDYLAYTLMDAVVDNYFSILERLGDKIEDIEETLIISPSSETLQTIQDLKREMLFLRKSVYPLREVINRLERWESELISRQTQVFLRDVYDHTIQVIDSVETFRDMLSGMLDIYLSSLSNRMNEIMKVLTIIATIFIPLTFISGIYGMNFRFMPELDLSWGYPVILALMLGIGIIMLMYFRRKNWI